MCKIKKRNKHLLIKCLKAWNHDRIRQILWIGPVSIPYMSPRNESCPAFGRGAVGRFLRSNLFIVRGCNGWKHWGCPISKGLFWSPLTTLECSISWWNGIEYAMVTAQHLSSLHMSMQRYPKASINLISATLFPGRRKLIQSWISYDSYS